MILIFSGKFVLLFLMLLNSSHLWELLGALSLLGSLVSSLVLKSSKMTFAFLLSLYLSIMMSIGSYLIFMLPVQLLASVFFAVVSEYPNA